MSEPEFHSFEEFWPFYVSQHREKLTRTLHFIGSTLALGAVAAATVTRRPALLLAAPLAGYGFAWVGHFFVEHNKPASFSYPMWSLRADAQMWWMTAMGTMDAEVERLAAREIVPPVVSHAHTVN